MVEQRILKWAVFSALLILVSAPGALAQEEKKPATSETGTGFIVGPEGHVLTCYSLIAKAAKVEVSLGGKTYDATLMASDPKHDLALLSIDAKGLTPLPLADSSQAVIGQEVQAFGFPISSLPGSAVKMTKSSISGTSPRDAMFLFDASAIPGISGGPLVNERGQVVGVISARMAGEIASNVGYAVPINYVIPTLRNKGIAFKVQDANEKVTAADLEKQVSAAVALILITPQGVEGDKTSTTPGEKPAEGEKKASGPPNCLWVSSAEMAEAAAAVEAKQQSLQNLEAAALKALATQVLGSVYLLEGLDLHEQKLDEEGAEYLKKAVALHPDSALTHAMLSVVATAAGDKELGEREKVQAEKLDPKVPSSRKLPASPMWVPRSEMESVRERLSSLVAEGAQPDAGALQAALKRTAALLAVWKGDYRWLRGVLPLAESEYARALSIDPECPEALTGSAYVAEKRNDLPGAQEKLRKALAADPKSERVLRAIQEFVVVYHKDFLPPRIDILAPKPGEQIPAARGNHLVFTVVDDIGKVEDIEVFLNRKSLAKKFGPGRYDIEWDARGLQYTKPTFRITAIDAAGNPSEMKLTIEVVPK